MPTLTCALTLPEGDSLTGSVKATFATRTVPVKWKDRDAFEIEFARLLKDL